MGRKCKYTEAMIDDIIARRKEGEKLNEIAESYGISGNAVASMIRYHRPEAFEEVRQDRMRRMAERWAAGWTAKQIADEFRLSPCTVYVIASQNRYLFSRRNGK